MFNISPQWVARGLVVVASLIALYFVGQYRHFHYDEVGWLARLGQLTSSLSPHLVFLTPHPNAVASSLASVLLLSLVLAWQAHNGERVVWGLIVAIITYGLLISGSRGAGVGLAVAVAIWTMLLIQNRGLRLAIAGIGLIGAALGVHAMIQIALTQSHIPMLTSALETASTTLRPSRLWIITSRTRLTPDLLTIAWSPLRSEDESCTLCLWLILGQHYSLDLAIACFDALGRMAETRQVRAARGRRWRDRTRPPP